MVETLLEEFHATLQGTRPVVEIEGRLVRESKETHKPYYQMTSHVVRGGTLTWIYEDEEQARKNFDKLRKIYKPSSSG